MENFVINHFYRCVDKRKGRVYDLDVWKTFSFIFLESMENLFQRKKQRKRQESVEGLDKKRRSALDAHFFMFQPMGRQRGVVVCHRFMMWQNMRGWQYPQCPRY